MSKIFMSIKTRTEIILIRFRERSKNILNIIKGLYSHNEKFKGYNHLTLFQLI